MWRNLKLSSVCLFVCFKDKFYKQMLQILNRVTYRIEEERQEELSSSDTVVEFTAAAWILVQEYSMREQATGLTRKHLQHRCILLTTIILFHFI